MIEVKVPDIGDFKDVPVIEVMVKPGDKVTLVVNPLRSGEHGGIFQSMTLADGRTLGGRATD